MELILDMGSEFVQLSVGKTAAAKKQGYAVIRFPYWIQLDSVTLKHFFKLEVTVKTSFPHGFITTRVYPASFCEMGAARFSNELDRLPEAVKAAALESLQERAKEHGIAYVMPSALRHLLTPRGRQ